MVGLDGSRAHAFELSGGQQQRVAVARALVLEPQVLLFDEPLSNLDAKLRRRVREDIRELQQSLRLTVAYVTHDQQEALAVSDRIIVMSNARIAQVGGRASCTRRRATASSPTSSAMPTSSKPSSARTAAHAPVRLGGVEIELEHRGARPGPVRVAIRPSPLFLAKAFRLRGTVRKAAYLGTHMEYT